ncbi:GT-D fold domain-containing protein [Paenibacillus chibensis]|nr:GT-D fold domain-containing glycosyltransferase [Paenibacillus chibensis]
MLQKTAAFIPLRKKAVPVIMIEKPNTAVSQGRAVPRRDGAASHRDTPPPRLDTLAHRADTPASRRDAPTSRRDAPGPRRDGPVPRRHKSVGQERVNGKKPAQGRRRRTEAIRLRQRRKTRKIFKQYRPYLPRLPQEVEGLPSNPSAGYERSETSYAQGFDMGYRAGSTAGAEEELASQLPAYTVLPEVSARDVLAAGLQGFLPRLKPLLRPDEVHHRIARALAEGSSLSLVRLGDGELLALAHDTVLPLEYARSAGYFLAEAGMTLPDPAARGLLAEAVRGADIIGIPSSRLPTYQGLLFPVLRYYGMDYVPMNLTLSTINYALYEHGFLLSLLRHKRVLVVGNLAAELAAVLSAGSVQIAGVITPVKGFADIPRVVSDAAAYSFDIALVASGIPAVVICQKIAAEQGRIAIDFGHLADKLVSGEFKWPIP